MIGEYATAAAFREALEERLRSRAEREVISIAFLRKRVVFESVLDRLLEVSDAWVLKGALALDLRSAATHRVTNDADLGVRSPVDAMREIMLRASEIDRGDGLELRIEIVETRPGSIRYRVHADLAGRLFDTIRIDLSSSDPILGPREEITVDSMLDFAGFESMRIPVLSLEQHLAEKVHAYTRTYESGPSSRTKDLLDMAWIARLREIDGPELRDAMNRTFERDRSDDMPDGLPPPPANWKVPYRNLAETLGVDPDLDAGYEIARTLLDPILAGEHVIRWSPASLEWNR